MVRYLYVKKRCFVFPIKNHKCTNKMPLKDLPADILTSHKNKGPLHVHYTCTR